MSNIHINVKKSHSSQEKILLLLLPFWAQLTPPLGISCIKSFIRKYGYNVITVDANLEYQFKEIYVGYFDTLKECIPSNHRGNFLNLGLDVLRNHMMAHLHNNNEKKYVELVKRLIFETFFCNVNDHQVSELDKKINDFYIKLEEYSLNLLNKERPGVLGLSVYNTTLPASMFVAKLTKKKYPHITTVIGGGIFTGQLEMASPDFEFFLEKTPYIDKIIIGEGEILFLKFLLGVLPKYQRVYKSDDINGEQLDLSSVDIPDFSDFNLQHYPYSSAYASRSCPFQCSFCAETTLWGNYRKKNAKQVVDELRKLYKKYGSRLFLMCDSLLNPIVTDLAKELLNPVLSIYWDGYLRVDEASGDIENTLLWRRGGFYRARLGVESGSQHVLNLMNKKITPSQIKAVIYSLASAGIKTTTYWMIGHPGETEDDFQQTLDLIEELNDYIYEAECNPFQYFYAGQVKSGEWTKKNNTAPLYPGMAREMLITQTWILKEKPFREETHKRVCRFVAHCSRLGIPNPYSLLDILKADERWKRLHKNAVPSVVELHDGHSEIDECKKVKKVNIARNPFNKDEDWISDF